MRIKQPRFLFMLSFLLVATMIVQMSLYSLHLYSNWTLMFSVLEACHNMLRAIGLSSMNMLLEVLILSTFSLIVMMIVKQIYRYITFSKRLSLLREDTVTEEIIRNYDLGKQALEVIRSDEPIALTYGMIRPKIVLSTELVSLLSEEELRAVIYHETFHQQHRDPLKKFIITLLVHALWFVPILKWVSNHYHTLREIAADRFAMKKANMLDLSSALLKLLKSDHRQRHAFAVSFAETSVNDRIQHILAPEKEVHVTLPVGTVLYSLYIVLGLSIMFMVATP
ncbi:M56 family metallopeptidase [Guptibacillus hwajinpoensis]|uniref:M56 family metallopeptidase n=1 Tax=Guptibacillus hwajinpoensis TaxID=208199 RepID=UPI001CFCDE12|nr:M56 family metallopeptidase [Pseudalkalibacillus hwajinpoensis]WLR61596.1 M56 family metallopeptidase [Pseudalkalibacillus hwajinpoensis]